jgi:predicted DCC family thiol-disulfide oxidoreductase YuxK
LLEHGWTVILYDGECELCSAIVKFIANRSRNSLLAFSAIQAASFQIERGRDNAARAYQTIFVSEGSQVLESGDAVIRLLQKMDRPLSALAVVARIAPVSSEISSTGSWREIAIEYLADGSPACFACRTKAGGSCANLLANQSCSALSRSLNF